MPEVCTCVQCISGGDCASGGIFKGIYRVSRIAALEPWNYWREASRYSQAQLKVPSFFVCFQAHGLILLLSADHPKIPPSIQGIPIPLHSPAAVALERLGRKMCFPSERNPLQPSKSMNCPQEFTPVLRKNNAISYPKK